MRYLVGSLLVLALVASPLDVGAQAVEEGVAVDSASSPAVGDLRFRLVVLGRFGLGGTLWRRFDDVFAEGARTTEEFDLKTTFGFDLRFEKPPAKYVTTGALLSNYWYDVEGFGRQYALDIAPFVKPRYPFLAGSKEAEVYFLVSIGGSLTHFDDEVYGGFNVALSPGFQIFVASNLALVFEVGYGFGFFQVGGAGNERLLLGQTTIRAGFAAAF